MASALFAFRPNAEVSDSPRLGGSVWAATHGVLQEVQALLVLLADLREQLLQDLPFL